jgi:hypothetical protein
MVVAADVYARGWLALHGSQNMLGCVLRNSESLLLLTPVAKATTDGQFKR